MTKKNLARQNKHDRRKKTLISAIIIIPQNIQQNS